MIAGWRLACPSNSLKRWDRPDEQRLGSKDRMLESGQRIELPRWKDKSLVCKQLDDPGSERQRCPEVRSRAHCDAKLLHR